MEQTEQESLRGKTVGEIITGLMSGKIKLADVKADMPSIRDTFDAFVQYLETINWKEEYWLQAWLAFCVILFVLIFAKRKNQTFVTCAFFFTNFFAFLGSIINDLGAKYWEKFSTKAYFDKEGAFVSLVYTFPLLVLSFLLLLILVFNLTSTMVELKKKKLEMEAKRKKKKEEESKDSSVSTVDKKKGKPEPATSSNDNSNNGKKKEKSKGENKKKAKKD